MQSLSWAWRTNRWKQCDPNDPVNPARPVGLMCRRSFRLTMWVWIAVAIAASARTWLRPEQHSVFPVYAAGASHWWNDEPLYVDYAPLDFLRYPPTVALFYTPFACLGATLGGIAWIWLNLAFLAGGLSAFRRHVLPGTWTSTRSATFSLLGLVVGLPSIWNGQCNTL